MKYPDSNDYLSIYSIVPVAAAAIAQVANMVLVKELLQLCKEKGLRPADGKELRTKRKAELEKLLADDDRRQADGGHPGRFDRHIELLVRAKLPRLLHKPSNIFPRCSAPRSPCRHRGWRWLAESGGCWEH